MLVHMAGLASSVALVVLVAGTPQGLYSDPGWQAKALQQYLAGTAPTPNHLVMPSPQDLSVDAPEWLFWHAPGTQIVLYPLVSVGLAPGHAVRLIAVLSILVGVAGWSRWFCLFALPRAILIVLAIGLPWVRQVSNALFLYSAEILVFAVTPWLLILTQRFSGPALPSKHAASLLLAFLGGLALGSVYWLKYSALLISAGALLYISIWYIADVNRAPRRTWTWLAAILAGAILPVAALSALNFRFASEANLVTAGAAFRPQWRTLLAATGNPALAALDLDAMLSYVLLHPGSPLVADHGWVELIGVPGGLVTAWLVFRGWARSPAHLLGSTVFVSGLALLLLIWTFSTSVSFEARHVAMASLAVLPLALSEGRRRFTEAPLRVKLVLGALGCLYVVAPLAYGPVSAVAKVVRTSDRYAVGPAAVYNPLLADTDIASVRETLSQATEGREYVWYLTEPMSALDLPGRAVIRHADFMTPEALDERFATTRPIRVHALLPDRFEQNGKGRIIRESFPGAAAWRLQAIDGSNYRLWSADLAPEEARTSAGLDEDAGKSR
jgi:hypothetical protein